MSDVVVKASGEVFRPRYTLEQIEYAMAGSGAVTRTDDPKTHIFPETHRFTPGLYIRELYMPAGSFLMSKTHTTTHPYVVSQGVASVYSEQDGPTLIIAPYTGITQAGTKRMLFIHEDTIWTTFHVTDLTDVAEIEKVIYAPWRNALIQGANGELK